MTQTDAQANRAQLLDVTDVPPERGVGRLIDHAAKMGASDLFLLSNEQHLAAKVRFMGLVQTIAIIPLEQGRRYIAHLRNIAGMDLHDRRQPHDGRWIFESDQGAVTDLRINVIPTLHGEDVAMRLLSRDAARRTPGGLGMSKIQESQYLGLLSTPGGLLLITGPTGSGKTTTLYSSLRHLNDGTKKINTIEDPIEDAVEGLRQAQVNPTIGLDFAALLRSVLRQSPDVIMIGEIRDAETADIAVRAANSGILVLATVHAPTAPGAIQSMRSFGTHPHFLSTSLLGVVSQRLVRTLCGKCRLSFDISHAPHTFEDVASMLHGDEGKTLYAPKGCDACQMTGYAGQTGVFELLRNTPAMRELIATDRPIADIRAQAVKDGMLEFKKAAMLKVARGESSTQEIFRVFSAEQLLAQ